MNPESSPPRLQSQSPKQANSSFRFTFGATVYNLSSRTHVMGILNVTPDSFSDGGRFDSRESAVSQALRMIDEGADFIDVGGESTRPGSDAVSLEDELRRVLPVVEAIAKRTIVPISIDTYKSEVAERALQAGACIINDISGMTFDDNMSHVAVEHHASVVLMHMQGTPRTMQQNPKYENVTREVKQFLKNRVKAARSAGIEQIIVDPGIGFGKNSEHNVQLIRELREFVEIGTPLLIGPSRKSFIGAILDLPVQERLEGTAAAVAVSVMNGAHILRVHDVKEMRRVAKVVDAFK